MVPVLLILIPLVTGLVSFFLKEGKSNKTFALLSSVITFLVAITGIYFLPEANLS